MNDVDYPGISAAQLFAQQTQRALEYVSAGSLDGSILAVALGHRDLLPIIFVVAKTDQPPRGGARLAIANSGVSSFTQIVIEPAISRKVTPQNVFCFRHT